MSDDVWPYSERDQMPPTRAPWQMGTELYEAAGRFLDRMEDGSVYDLGDGGWMDHAQKIGYDLSAGYDSRLGFATEAEAEAHRQREEAKRSRAPAVDAAAMRKIHELHTERAAAKVAIVKKKASAAQWRDTFLQALKAHGRPACPYELDVPGGKKGGKRNPGMIFRYLAHEGLIRKTGVRRQPPSGNRNWQFEWEVVEN